MEEENNTLFKAHEVFMGRREFSFEIVVAGTEIYSRYQSFDQPAKLQRALVAEHGNETMIQKIDIGAVFNEKPSKTNPIIPL